jgi:hypothetical protein
MYSTLSSSFSFDPRQWHIGIVLPTVKLWPNRCESCLFRDDRSRSGVLLPSTARLDTSADILPCAAAGCACNECDSSMADSS